MRLLGGFPCRPTFLRADADAFDLHARQFSPMSDGAMITFTPLKFERDDFFIFPLLDNFGRDLCARDERITVREIVAIGMQQHVAKDRGFSYFRAQ